MRILVILLALFFQSCDPVIEPTEPIPQGDCEVVNKGDKVGIVWVTLADTLDNYKIITRGQTCGEYWATALGERASDVVTTRWPAEDFETDIYIKVTKFDPVEFAVCEVNQDGSVNKNNCGYWEW